jgi:hypothetical protein
VAKNLPAIDLCTGLAKFQVSENPAISQLAGPRGDVEMHGLKCMPDVDCGSRINPRCGHQA